MNRYARTAQRYWETYLPSRVSAIPAVDREEFFTRLGLDVEQEILTLEPTLAGPDLPQEEYLEKVGRLNNARLRAEESVLAETVYLPAEPGTQDRELTSDLPPGVHTI